MNFGITSLLQPGETGMCGQAVVAMAAGVSLEAATTAIGVSTLREAGTDSTDIVRGLRVLKMKPGKCTSYYRRKGKLKRLPAFAVLSVVDNKTTWGHWVLLKDGFIHDPGIGWPLPIHIYEGMIIERAFSRRYRRVRDAGKRVRAYWGDVIPILHNPKEKP
jgi:hypothetical protein